ncbi:putative trans-sialidase, Group II [Trypanosoma cruzi]|uniref:Putative trans-sialidase, Group II n=1 Tax=Trypanosoma cruzi TaxID=5693 RepID=A0A2V2UQK9_TRYCR|nr:putative trans-sialidase, Group II [Trypanosoma cruzi]
MFSRVAAVMAPRTHNRRCVTGSSGRRREGGESEPQRPNMSRRVFASAVLFLLVVIWICCNTGGAAAVVGGKSGDAPLPHWVDIFLPEKTQVLPKEGSESGVKKAFAAPSLVSAGGVMVAFAEGYSEYNAHENNPFGIKPYEIVAVYIKAAESWPSIVAEVNASTWRAHTVIGGRNGNDRLCFLYRPTAVARENKVFLLVESDTTRYDNVNNTWVKDDSDIQLVEGVATQSTDGVQSTLINWAEPKSILQQIPKHTQDQLRDVAKTGGSGIVMQNGTLVFPLVAKGKNYPFSIITYSTDNGNNWVFPESISPVGCFDPRITEWETGQILMIVQCIDGQRVYESRDMGTTWTKAVRTLSGVWVISQPGVRWDEGLRVDALMTATIEGRKVMLYIQRVYTSGENVNPLYLWVTDNNRSFHVGPLFLEDNVNETLVNALLYSDGALHLLKERVNEKDSAISLARLTEELNTIKSVLRTWAKLDAFFSESSTPTAGLVGFLSNTSSGGDTWIDEYRCVDASVTKASKVKNGFKFTGPGFGATWPVNRREDNRQYGFVNYDFTIVATVTIHQVAKGSTPLLGAGLGDGHGAKIIGLSYSMNKTWETVFDGKKTTSNTTWEPGKEHQVALMLQDGNKGSVYVDGVIVGSPAKIPKVGALGHEITHFYFGGGEGDINSSVTVTNVFLYNRPLSVGELKMVRKSDDKKGNGDGSMRGGMSRLLLLLLGLCAFVALY